MPLALGDDEGQPVLSQDSEDKGGRRLAAVEPVRVAQSLGCELGTRPSVHRQPFQHAVCTSA